jgi:hypothetical protein
MPETWIVAMEGLDPLAPSGIDLDGTWVAYTVTVGTDDPAVMSAALRQLRRIVADTATTCHDIPLIDQRLPAQIGSAHWRNDHGAATVIHPKGPRHRRPQRFWSLGVPLAGWWVAMHARIPAGFGPLGAVAGVLAVASVTGGATPVATPAHIRPGTVREMFVPPRHTTALAGTKPAAGSSSGPPRLHMAAPAQATASPAAGSPPQAPASAATPPQSTTSATPSTKPTVALPKPTIGVTLTLRCVTAVVLGLKVTTCSHSQRRG